MKNKFGQTMKNTVKMNFGILMGLVILCLGLTVLTDKFATVTNFLTWCVKLPSTSTWHAA